MRNEIYNRIRQNKLRYYAELNSTKEKETVITNSLEEISEPDTKVPNEKISKERNTLLKKVYEYNYKSLFKKVPKAVQSGYKSTVKCKAAEALRTQVKNDHEKIKQFNILINRKIDGQTEKIAHGVYNLSSFLFEDALKTKPGNDFSDGTLVAEAIGNNTIEWNFAKEGQTSTNFYDKLGVISEKSFAWFRSLPDRIVNYLASDNLPEPNDAHMLMRNSQ